MTPIRLLHTADLHIGMENYGQIDPATGINGRVLDFLRRLDDAVGYALEHEIDLVLFAGDAYKTRNPNSTYRREFARRIRRLADAGVPVVLLVGNHDLPSMQRKASSVEIFDTLRVPNVLVAKREGLHRLRTRRGDEIQVATVPYPLRRALLTHDEFKGLSLADLDVAVRGMMAANIGALAAQVDRDMPAVLMGHFSVSEATWGSERSVMLGRDVIVPLSSLADPTWDYVALGHIHKHQALNGEHHPPVVYAGSLERIDFGEEREEKGFVVAEVTRGQTTWHFQQVAARRFVTLTFDVREAADPTEAVAEGIGRHDVSDAVVRLIIHALPEQDGLLRDADVRRALSEAYFVASIQKEIERQHRTRLGDQGAEGLTPRELLELYLDSKDTPRERVQALLEHADELLDAVQDA
jgi:exonuclease SbcD